MARIAQIVSTARYLPEHIVPNAELAARFAALDGPGPSKGWPAAPASTSVFMRRRTG
jgi:hypothetical protein